MADHVIVNAELRDGLKEPLRSDSRIRTHSTRLQGPRAMAQPARRTVLVAEDDEGLRSSISRRLRRSGYEVHEAADGLELVRSCADVSASFDVVISDVKMPKMEGPTALNALVALSPTTPIILMTAFPSDDVYAAADKLGAFCVLEKPTSIKRLIDNIESACLSA